MYLLSYSSRCIWVSISSSHSASILFIHFCIVCSCLHFMLCLSSIHIHSISLRKLVGLHVMLKSIIRVLWCSIITDEVLRVLIGQRVSTQRSNCSKSLRSRGEEKNKDNSPRLLLMLLSELELDLQQIIGHCFCFESIYIIAITNQHVDPKKRTQHEE